MGKIQRVQFGNGIGDVLLRESVGIEIGEEIFESGDRRKIARGVGEVEGAPAMSRPLGDGDIGCPEFAERFIGGMHDQRMRIDGSGGIEFDQVWFQHHALAAYVQLVAGHHPVNGVVDVHVVGGRFHDGDAGNGKPRFGSSGSQTIAAGQIQTRQSRARESSGHGLPSVNSYRQIGFHAGLTLTGDLGFLGNTTWARAGQSNG